MPLVSMDPIKFFQYWVKVDPVNVCPWLDTNNVMACEPLCWVSNLCPSCICASRSFTKGPSGREYERGDPLSPCLDMTKCELL